MSEAPNSGFAKNIAPEPDGTSRVPLELRNDLTKTIYERAGIFDLKAFYSSRFSANPLGDFVTGYPMVAYDIRYLKEHFIYQKVVKPGRVLDLGCGGGRLGVLKSRPGVELYGLDLTDNTFDLARSVGYDHLIAHNILDIPFPPAFFDYVVSLDVLGHIEGKDKLRLLGEIKRVLKPGGLTLHGVEEGEADYNNMTDDLINYIWIDGHVGLQTIDQINALFSTQFENVKTEFAFGVCHNYWDILKYRFIEAPDVFYETLKDFSNRDIQVFAIATGLLRQQLAQQNLIKGGGFVFVQATKPLIPRQPESLVSTFANPKTQDAGGTYQTSLKEDGSTQALAPNNPLISVIIPCYNHGIFLDECLASVFNQTYQPLEIIVIDDGSPDAQTVETVERWSEDSRLTVLRQPNFGPSIARNRAIAHAKGRYILPLDADNYLAPSAIQNLYDQLSVAPPDVKFIYQGQQFFGNRTDYAVQPDYNLYFLLQVNYCDTCALIDRSVFDEGCKFREDIGLGHEDWDFFLQLAQKGYYGQPDSHKNLFYRKTGFTRSDSVLLNHGSFQHALKNLHPNLYNPVSLLRIKRRWSPALSIILDWPDDSDRASLETLGRRLNDQTCQDFEIVGPAGLVGQLDSVTTPVEMAGESDPQNRLTKLINAARGKFMLLWPTTSNTPLQDRACLEKAVRLLENGHYTGSVALVGLEGTTNPAWQELVGPDLAGGQRHRGLGVLLKTDFAVRHLTRLTAVNEANNPYARLLANLARVGEQEGLYLGWRGLRAEADPGLTLIDFDFTPTSLTQLLMPTDSATDTLEFINATRLANPSYQKEFEFRMFNPPMFAQSSQGVRPPVLSAERYRAEVNASSDRIWQDWQPDRTAPLYLLYNRHTEEHQLATDPADFTELGYYVQAVLGNIYTQHFVATQPLLRTTEPKRLKTIYQSGSVTPTFDAPPEPNTKIIGYLSPTYLYGMLPLHQMKNSRTGEVIFTTDYTMMSEEGYRSEQFFGFLEPSRLEPVIVETNQPDKALTLTQQRLWPLYEYYDPARSDYLYSLQPDLYLNAGWPAPTPIGNIFAEVGPGRFPLYRLYSPDEDKHLYSLDRNGGREWGFALQGLVGYVPVRFSQPVLYHYYQTATRTHRLATTDLSGTGYELIEPMWNIYPINADALTLPLYRWYDPAQAIWHYTTGLDAQTEPGWQPEGALGLLPSVTTSPDKTALVNFYRLRQPSTGRVVYTISPAQLEAAGYVLEEVVARFEAVESAQVVPVFHLYSPGADQHLYTLNPLERNEEGYMNQGVVGYVSPASPPPPQAQWTVESPGYRRLRVARPGATDEWLIDGLVFEAAQPGTHPLYELPDTTFPTYTVAPDLALSGTAKPVGYILSGPRPGAWPLYRMRQNGGSSETFCTTNPLLAGQNGLVIECVVGYMIAAAQPDTEPNRPTAQLPAGPQSRLAGLEERLNYIENTVLPAKNQHIANLEQHIRNLESSRALQAGRRVQGVLGRLRPGSGKEA